MNAIVFCRSLSQVIGCLAVRAGDQGLPTARWQDKAGYPAAVAALLRACLHVVF